MGTTKVSWNPEMQKEYGHHFQYAEDRKELTVLLERARMLRERIAKYEGDHQQRRNE